MPIRRDSAYHQGTVWAWLLGPYLTALVKVRGETGRRQGLKLMQAIERAIENASMQREQLIRYARR